MERLPGEMELRLPFDWTRWPEFRSLCSSLGIVPATFTLIQLWTELGHMTAATGRVGFFPDSNLPLLLADFREAGDPEAILQQLKASGLLQTTEAGLTCPRFVKLHPHLAPDFKPMHLKGAEATRFVRRQRREADTDFAQALLLDDSLFMRPDRNQMDPDEVRRVRLLIRTLDNALGQPARQAHQFGEGLIQDAYTVIKAVCDRDLVAVCRQILSHRGHPAMPKTSEQILPRWQEVARMVVSS